MYSLICVSLILFENSVGTTVPSNRSSNKNVNATTTKKCGDNQTWTPQFLHRCFYPHCLEYNGQACPNQTLVKISLKPIPSCACNTGYAYVTEKTCAKLNTDECSGISPDTWRVNIPTIGKFNY